LRIFVRKMIKIKSKEQEGRDKLGRFSEGNKIGKQFTKGNPSRLISGFYMDNFLPCNEKCPQFHTCKRKETIKDQYDMFRCAEEIDFFNETKEKIEREFNLDEKDKFQLPLMIMRIIKVKRQNRYEAMKGVTEKSILFNPVTGEEKAIEIPNRLNRDVYYAEKVLMAWLDSLKLSRSSREASNKIDIFANIINSGERKRIEG